MSRMQPAWQFGSHIAALEQCPTNLASQRARASAGVCDLSIGDVKFDTPEHIKQAAMRAIAANDTHYTHVQGSEALRAAIQSKLWRENGLACDVDDIVVGNGAGQLIFAAFFATLEAGDEVVIPTPCWDNYADMVRLNRGVPRFVVPSWGDRLSMADVINAITPRTRWIVLNNPNNPGGFAWSEPELRSLASCLSLVRTPIGVIADETFEKLCFSRRQLVSFASLPGMQHRTLTVNGLSKSHAMAGWRIGYAAGPRCLIEKISLFNANTTYSVCSIAQAAAAAALADTPEAERSLRQLKIQIEASRFAACSRLSLLSNVSFAWPEAGYFVLLDVRQLLARPGEHDAAAFASTQEVCDYLLAAARVAATDGEGFQAPGHIRLSFAGPEHVIAPAYDRVVTALVGKPLRVVPTVAPMAFAFGTA